MTFVPFEFAKCQRRSPMLVLSLLLITLHAATGFVILSSSSSSSSNSALFRTTTLIRPSHSQRQYRPAHMSKSSRSSSISSSSSSSDGKHDDNDDNDLQEASAPIHYNDFGDNIANNNNNNNNQDDNEDDSNNNTNTNTNNTNNNEEEFDDEYEREPVLCADARGRPAGVVLEDLNWRVEKLRLEEANKRRFLKAGPRFLPYAECQKWVQAWGLRWTSEEEWKDWIASGEKRNSYIPSRPEEYFTRTGDWISWEHFLGVPEKDEGSKDE
eukprot:CAMPEP_0172390864 /NCGR_PEP_ID=MMETSP1061-20121228/7423_1 /TAXON_ID=37318 /ORGANISM="Pseudo-nitzschia pungens, Strain cf. pungens" /LENGTH=268 /DNA_ID=CAMNT_0013121359 /DNA_START=348 /DNA_END=1154 /DNA_ORIENTATION=-